MLSGGISSTAVQLDVVPDVDPPPDVCQYRSPTAPPTVAASVMVAFGRAYTRRSPIGGYPVSLLPVVLFMRMLSKKKSDVLA